MPLLTRDQITGAKDLKTEDVEVPEWGGTVRVRTLSGAERDQWESSILNEDRKLNAENIRGKFAALVLVDEQGQPLFNELDAQILGRKSAKALQRIFEVGQKLNGLRKEDVEELSKNSGGGQSAASGSSSQPASE